ncbi:glycosyltransferase family 2 protein [Salmonella enterica]|uniref:Glycosyltransferase n=1 Tax=Salmonella enterica TaxID=28901 RepID=U3GKA7_SALER|nr:glycosyltransferase family 2 protein [Salmonella enterica]EBS0794790.1 glycosyltransferase family 2 protein [Salmonella enterica subsp. enterica serovar Overschie]EBZ5137409.1 glycosyltransferase family 2 protein [Salmonella enterica subsp. enterica serovar Antsalova]ECB7315311.1 glycosyltransferase family 2 protein [Salmonella enterica subsp. enterica serovar Treforest]ECJ8275422.1 glycosyltransferase family 2 protein [Salmonella enterica subsp. enterica]EHI8597965.1 glycosyltransferase fa
MSVFFSIITPTYNRKKELEVLFESLNRQVGVSFEWVIIDDGSIDDTKEWVNKFVNNNNLYEIRYFYQENQGKNSAVNKGIQIARGEYIAIIDSDDYLYDNALACVKNYLDQDFFILNKELIGISGVKVDNEMTPVSFVSDRNMTVMSHYDWFYNERRLGDRIDFYKASVLKANIINHFPKEKFVTEDALWLDLKGKKLFINDRLLVVKYMDDGLSSRYASLLKQNPFGSAYYYYVLLINSNNTLIKCKASILIIYYAVLTIIKNNNIFIGSLSILISPIICLLKSFRK